MWCLSEWKKMAQVNKTKEGCEKSNFTFEIKWEVSVCCLVCENLGELISFSRLTKL